MQRGKRVNAFKNGRLGSKSRCEFQSLSFAGFEGKSEDIILHYHLYKCIWKRISCQLQEMQRKTYMDLANEVGKFFKSYASMDGERLKSVIPVASITTGLIGDENTQLFNLIIQKIGSTSKPFLVRIDAAIKLTVKNILHSVMDQLKKQKCKSELFISPNNKNGIKADPTFIHCRPLVIIIECIELLENVVIQNLFRVLCCGRNKQIQIFLILGSAYGYYSWKSIVPQDVKSSYVQEEFHGITPNERLTSFFKIVLNPRFPLKLSGSVTKYFIHHFETRQFSISRLIAAFRLCLMSQFRENKNALCISLALQTKLKEVRDSFAGQPKNGNRNLLHCSQQLFAVPTEYHRRFLIWQAVLNFLLGFSKRLHSNTQVGASFAELYVLALEKNLLIKPNTDNGHIFSPIYDFSTLVTKSASVSTHHLQACLQNGLNQMQGFSTLEPEILSICKNIEILINMKLAPEVHKAVQEKARCLRSIDRPVTTAGFKEMQRNFMLSNNVPNAIEASTKEFFKELQKHLEPPTTVEMSETFIFQDLDFLQQQISPQIQEAMQKDVLNQTASGDFSNRLDISNLYTLILEQQIININLDDISQAFLTISFPNYKRRTSTATPDDLQLHRLKQAVLELQLIGFVRSNKRKSDELVRQIWNC